MALDPWTRAKSGTEHGEQSALFMWCNMARMFSVAAAEDPASYSVAGHAQRMYGAPQGGECIPELGRLYAIKNQGHGDKIRGNQSKAEGVKAGVPDIFLPAPRHAGQMDATYWQPFVSPFGGGGYGFGVICGLYIELKRPGSKKVGKRKAEVVDQAAGVTSSEQDDWVAYLRSQGYAVVVAYGWREAADVMLRYLGLGSLTPA